MVPKNSTLVKKVRILLKTYLNGETLAGEIWLGMAPFSNVDEALEIGEALEMGVASEICVVLEMGVVSEMGVVILWAKLASRFKSAIL